MAKGMEKLASMINVGLMGLLIVCWTGMLFFSSAWHRKASIWYNADISLWGMEVSHGALVGGGDFMMRGMGKTEQTMLSNLAVGSYSWQQTTQYMCQISKSFAVGFLGLNGCQVWRTLRTMSIVLGLFMFTGIIMLCLASYFHYYYWFVKESRRTRLWCRAFLIIAPACFMMGLTMYMFLTKRLADFPPSTGGTFGFSFVFSWFYCLLTFIPLFVHETFSSKHINEDLREEFKILKNQELSGIFHAQQSVAEAVQHRFPGWGWEQQEGNDQEQAWGNQGNDGQPYGQLPASSFAGQPGGFGAAPGQPYNQPYGQPPAGFPQSQGGLQAPGPETNIRASGHPMAPPPSSGQSGAGATSQPDFSQQGPPVGFPQTRGAMQVPSESAHIRASGMVMPAPATVSAVVGPQAAPQAAAEDVPQASPMRTSDRMPPPPGQA